MPLFRWNFDLETGVELIDRQHWEIFERINAFYIQYRSGESKKAATQCLRFLRNYILYHFQAEEAFQVESHYPDYRIHQAAHKWLGGQVKFYSVRLEADQYGKELMDEFYEFLLEWVTQHIQEEDKKFAAYYRDFKGPVHYPSPEEE